MNKLLPLLIVSMLLVPGSGNASGAATPSNGRQCDRGERTPTPLPSTEADFQETLATVAAKSREAKKDQLVAGAIEHEGQADYDLFHHQPGGERICILKVVDLGEVERTDEASREPGASWDTQKVTFRIKLVLLARNRKLNRVAVVRFTTEASAVSKDQFKQGLAAAAFRDFTEKLGKRDIALSRTPMCGGKED